MKLSYFSAEFQNTLIHSLLLLSLNFFSTGISEDNRPLKIIFVPWHSFPRLLLEQTIVTFALKFKSPWEVWELMTTVWIQTILTEAVRSIKLSYVKFAKTNMGLPVSLLRQQRIITLKWKPSAVGHWQQEPGTFTCPYGAGRIQVSYTALIKYVCTEESVFEMR